MPQIALDGAEVKLSGWWSSPFYSLLYREKKGVWVEFTFSDAASLIPQSLTGWGENSGADVILMLKTKIKQTKKKEPCFCKCLERNRR